MTYWEPPEPEVTPPVPAGWMGLFAANSPPDGYLECDGSVLNKNTYTDLFDVIGYTWGGAGNNFNLPDLRGEFLRGWDHGRGVDPGRVFGSWQQATSIGGAEWPVGPAGLRFRGMQNSDGTDGTFNAEIVNVLGDIVTYTYCKFRPRNLALMPCIKY